jgi:hypothetical protein
MKVILTGSTGTIGSAVLAHCLSDPAITSIVSLTRRPLDSKDAKLTNLIKSDYKSYTPSEISALKGAEACIWVLGSPTVSTKEVQEVHVDYTRVAIKMLLENVVPTLQQGRPFRFVYTSGGAVPYLESNALFFLGAMRKARGDLDREVLATETQNSGRWESFVVRPWFVVDEKPRIGYVFGDNSWVLRPELGAAMVDAALNGGRERIISNTELRRIGQKVLEKTKL